MKHTVKQSINTQSLFEAYYKELYSVISLVLQIVLIYSILMVCRVNHCVSTYADCYHDHHTSDLNRALNERNIINGVLYFTVVYVLDILVQH